MMSVGVSLSWFKGKALPSTTVNSQNNKYLLTATADDDILKKEVKQHWWKNTYKNQ